MICHSLAPRPVTFYIDSTVWSTLHANTLLQLMDTSVLLCTVACVEDGKLVRCLLDSDTTIWGTILLHVQLLYDIVY